MALSVRVAETISVAIIHVTAHVRSHALAATISVSFAIKVAFLNEIKYKLHGKIRLEGWDHVAGLRHHNHREVIVMSVPASNFLRTVKLVQVGVYLARLLIKQLTVGEVNLFYPLESLAHTVFHVIIADIN